MTRDDFEEWLDDHQENSLDDMPQSDTTPKKWLARLYASLVTIANEEEAESTGDIVDPDGEDDTEESLAGDDEEEA